MDGGGPKFAAISPSLLERGAVSVKRSRELTMAARPQLAVATSFAFGSVHDSSTHARGVSSTTAASSVPQRVTVCGPLWPASAAEVVVLTDAISAAREECAAADARYTLYDAALARGGGMGSERRRTKRMPDSDGRARRPGGSSSACSSIRTSLHRHRFFFETAGVPPPRGSRHWGILERAWTTRFDAFKAAATS